MRYKYTAKYNYYAYNHILERIQIQNINILIPLKTLNSIL